MKTDTQIDKYDHIVLLKVALVALAASQSVKFESI